jgi:hypothetical protein
LSTGRVRSGSVLLSQIGLLHESGNIAFPDNTWDPWSRIVDMNAFISTIR